MARFRHNADRLGLCDTFAQKWSNCKSKKQLYDLACNVNSLSYLAEMIAKGYGLTPDYLSREFGQFLNGKCIYNGDGYSSCIYCRPPEDEIDITTTAALIIGFEGNIIVDRLISELYFVNSNVTINNGGIVKVFLYNSNVIKPDAKVIIESKKEY